MYEDEDLQEIYEDIIELDADISVLRKDLNNISASVEGSGENVTLNGTAEARFKKSPLPMGNSEQVQYSGKNLFNINQERIDRSSESQILNNTLKIITSGTWAGTDFLGVSVIANQTYLLTFKWDSNVTLSGTDARIYIYSGNEIGTLLDYVNLTGTSGTVSKTITPTTETISVRFSPNNTGEAKSITMNFSDIMISENGGTYEPYVRTEQQVLHHLIHKK